MVGALLLLIPATASAVSGRGLIAPAEIVTAERYPTGGRATATAHIFRSLLGDVPVDLGSVVTSASTMGDRHAKLNFDGMRVGLDSVERFTEQSSWQRESKGRAKAGDYSESLSRDGWTGSLALLDYFVHASDRRNAVSRIGVLGGSLEWTDWDLRGDMGDRGFESVVAADGATSRAQVTLEGVQLTLAQLLGAYTDLVDGLPALNLPLPVMVDLAEELNTPLAEHLRVEVERFSGIVADVRTAKALLDRVDATQASLLGNVGDDTAVDAARAAADDADAALAQAIADLARAEGDLAAAESGLAAATAGLPATENAVASATAVHAAAQSDVNALQTQASGLQGQIDSLNARIAWLNEQLADPTQVLSWPAYLQERDEKEAQVSSLTAELNTVQAALSSAHSALSSASSALASAQNAHAHQQSAVSGASAAVSAASGAITTANAAVTAGQSQLGAAQAALAAAIAEAATAVGGATAELNALLTTLNTDLAMVLERLRERLDDLDVEGLQDELGRALAAAQLLRIGGVTIALESRATATSATSAVECVLHDVALLSTTLPISRCDELQGVVDRILGTLGEVLGALNTSIAVQADPVAGLTVRTPQASLSDGVAPDGTRIARAELTALEVRVPSVAVRIPIDPVLDLANAAVAELLARPSVLALGDAGRTGTGRAGQVRLAAAPAGAPSLAEGLEEFGTVLDEVTGSDVLRGVETDAAEIDLPGLATEALFKAAGASRYPQPDPLPDGSSDGSGLGDGSGLPGLPGDGADLAQGPADPGTPADLPDAPTGGGGSPEGPGPELPHTGGAPLAAVAGLALIGLGGALGLRGHGFGPRGRGFGPGGRGNGGR